MWPLEQGGGGFITFPSATYAFDPGSIKSLGTQPTARYYDHAVSAWLPVGRATVAPDGLHYATTVDGVVNKDGTVQAPAMLKIVTAATGASRGIALIGLRPAAGTTVLSPMVMDLEPDAAYLLEPGQAGTGELYKVELASGSVTYLTWVGRPEDVEAGALWYGELSPTANMGADPVSVKRWDLSSRNTTLWFSRPTGSVFFLGLDPNGAAVVEVISYNADSTVASVEIWLVARPGSETRIYQAAGSDEAALTDVLGLISDAHGLWFGADNGIWLYNSASGMNRVSTFAGGPANGCF